MLGGGAAAAAAGLAAAMLAGRREEVSLGAWLIRTLALPLVVPARKRTLAAFYRRLAADRLAGPAAPPERIRSRFAITDAALGGTRTYRLQVREREVSRHIFYLHGGAFVFSLTRAHWSLFAALADRSGAEVVAPLFPMAPEHDVDAALSATTRAYLALAAEVGHRNIVLAGDSSGGGLALALAHRLRDLGEPLPVSMVLFAPWLDVGLADPAQVELAASDPVLSIKQLREAGRMWSGALEPTDARVSPLFGNQADLPPVLVQVGTRDLLLPDARRLAERCPSVVLREYPGMFHGWIAAPIPEARQAISVAASFMAARG